MEQSPAEGDCNEECTLKAVIAHTLHFCSDKSRSNLRATGKSICDVIDAASTDYALPRGSVFNPQRIVTARPLLTSLTLTPTHLQQRPDFQCLEACLLSLTVKSNLRRSAWQRSGQGAVLLMLSRLTPLRRLKHLSLSDCLVGDTWDSLAQLRRLTELDLGGLLEVDNKLLTVLPLLGRLKILALPGPEGYSPRYNQCSAQGFIVCVQRLQVLATPPPAGMRVRCLPSVSSCSNLVAMAEANDAGGTGADSKIGPRSGSSSGGSSSLAARGLRRLELRGLSYSRHGLSALLHSRPSPLADSRVLEVMVESLKGLQALVLEEVGGSGGHCCKTVAVPCRLGRGSSIDLCAAPELPSGCESKAEAAGRCCTCGTAVAAGTDAGAAVASDGGTGDGDAPYANTAPCAVLQQCLHFEVLSRLTSLTSLVISAHVHLEFRDGEERPSTGGSATVPVCDGLLLRWIPPPPRWAQYSPPPGDSQHLEHSLGAAAARGAGATGTAAAAAATASAVTCPGPATACGTAPATCPAFPRAAAAARPPPAGSFAPWAQLQELALRELWDLGQAGLDAVRRGLPQLTALDLTGSGRSLAPGPALGSIAQLTALRRLRLGRATRCAWCLPDPFGGHLLEEDECRRSVSELCTSLSPSVAVQLAVADFLSPEGRNCGVRTDSPASGPCPLREEGAGGDAAVTAMGVGAGGQPVGAGALSSGPRQSRLGLERSATVCRALAASGLGSGGGGECGRGTALSQHVALFEGIQLAWQQQQQLQQLGGGSGGVGMMALGEVGEDGIRRPMKAAATGADVGACDVSTSVPANQRVLHLASEAEECYQDIDWDAFADARHSIVADPDMDLLGSGSTALEKEAPCNASCNRADIHALLDSALGIAASEPSSPCPTVGTPPQSSMNYGHCTAAAMAEVVPGPDPAVSKVAAVSSAAVVPSSDFSSSTTHAVQYGNGGNAPIPTRPGLAVCSAATRRRMSALGLSPQFAVPVRLAGGGEVPQLWDGSGSLSQPLAKRLPAYASKQGAGGSPGGPASVRRRPSNLGATGILMNGKPPAVPRRCTVDGVVHRLPTAAKAQSLCGSRPSAVGWLDVPSVPLHVVAATTAADALVWGAAPAADADAGRPARTCAGAAETGPWAAAGPRDGAQRLVVPVVGPNRSLECLPYGQTVSPQPLPYGQSSAQVPRCSMHPNLGVLLHANGLGSRNAPSHKAHGSEHNALLMSAACGNDDGSGGGEALNAVRTLAAALASVEELDLGSWPVSAALLQSLVVPYCKARLRRLGLAACRLDDAAVVVLRGLSDLLYLDISSSRPEAFLLHSLAAMPGLEEVEVRGCRLYYDSGKALQQLAASKAVWGLNDCTGLGLVMDLRGEHVLL